MGIDDCVMIGALVAAIVLVGAICCSVWRRQAKAAEQGGASERDKDTAGKEGQVLHFASPSLLVRRKVLGQDLTPKSPLTTTPLPWTCSEPQVFCFP